MVAFEWFIFHPLNFQEFQDLFQVSSEQSKIWFTWWLEEYNHLSWRFYNAQYKRHKLLEFRKFSRAYSLELSYPEDLSMSEDPIYYSELWEEWKSSDEPLQEHLEAVNLFLDHPASQMLRKKGKTSMSETMEQFYCQLEQGWDIDLPKALWFNSNISQTSPNNLVKLRSLPYSEYLKTSHWKKTRAAMLFIEQARCNVCRDGDSFYGGDWEREIHVHHVHYRNLGCERYEDLQLLCHRHHEQEHNH